MNATSSRAHTITTIGFRQKFLHPRTGEILNEKSSNVNLIDLAGSERLDGDDHTADRMVEGSNINKSLMILGKCIAILAKKSTGAGVKEVVPFRESKLTFILKQALGGNSRTSMIAALSPASVNFEETLSTLRYAWQVKSIRTQAEINESAQDKLIRELQQENEKLKKLYGGGGGMSEDMKEEADANRRMLEQMKREKDEFE
jgi:hypothetical protein